MILRSIYYLAFLINTPRKFGKVISRRESINFKKPGYLLVIIYKKSIIKDNFNENILVFILNIHRKIKYKTL